MTARQDQAGAASRKAVDWHSIDWHNVHSNVRRLQARIVKATQAGRWNKVNALQRLLTHSFSGKALAVKRVTENAGKHTPGVDQVIWDTPQKKATAIGKLRQRGYHPLPLRRVYIPKGNSQQRPLSIPSMSDRAQQALHLLALDPVAETISDPNVYGFRPERSTHDAIGQCFVTLSKRHSPQWILEGDIRSCFDQISHQWLETKIPMDKAILGKWLKAGYIDQSVFHQTLEGTPQGGICSPVLARLALNGLEHRLREIYPKGSPESRRAKVNIVVYADDFVITGSSRELLETQVKPVVEAFLHERGLELSPQKTKITSIQNGFDFLGQHIRKYHGKLLIIPSRKNVKNFLTKVRHSIQTHLHLKPERLIAILNPMIRGWAHYHQHVVSKMVFERVDSAIFHALWQWARRRHPTKSRQWIAHRYFVSLGNHHWRFGTPTDHLFLAASVPITRHTKIIGEANPYDPQWEVYFETRLGFSMIRDFKHRHRFLTLWLQQNGNCLHCAHVITKSTGWHVHHLEYRVHGGSNRLTNLVLLHPNCHQQVHSRHLLIVKPRPPTPGVQKA